MTHDSPPGGPKHRKIHREPQMAGGFDPLEPSPPGPILVSQVDAFSCPRVLADAQSALRRLRETPPQDQRVVGELQDDIVLQPPTPTQGEDAQAGGRLRGLFDAIRNPLALFRRNAPPVVVTGSTASNISNHSPILPQTTTDPAGGQSLAGNGNVLGGS